MRTYQRTHPWITFQLDMRQVSFKVWLLLGHARASCMHIAGMPMRPELGQELMLIYMAKGVLATTAIEGNTLTEEQVQKRIEHKLDLPPSKEYLGQEIDNVVTACNEIGRRALFTEDINLCVDEIKAYNAMVLKNLPIADNDVVPGEIRKHVVGVGRYRGAPPEDLEYLLQKLCDWLNSGFSGFEDQIDPLSLNILKAIIAHLYFAWIHPFADGNGRVARLIEFQLLLTAGVPVTAAHLLSNHYNQTRTEYYRLLDQSCRHENGVFEFIEYALQGFVDNLEDQINRIEAEQLKVQWRDYVYDIFRNKTTVTSQRRRSLVLDLSEKDQPVPFAELRHISPRIAEAYAGKTDKTIKRDVNVLRKMQLVYRTPDGIRANTQQMLAMLPPRRLDRLEDNDTD